MVSSHASEDGSSQKDFLVDVFGLNPITADWMVRAEVWPQESFRWRRGLDRLLERLTKDHRLYLETRDPVILMNAYVSTLASGISPPRWVSSALTDSFEKALDGENQPLSLLLGLSVGRGKVKHSDRRKREIRDFHLAKEMFWLRCFFNVSRDDAGTLLEAKLWARTFRGLDLDIVSGKEITQIYDTQKWPKHALEQYRETGYHPFAVLGQEYQDLPDFLSTFPENEITATVLEKLKQRDQTNT